jgi:membrane associated rhomboid family serine protease
VIPLRDINPTERFAIVTFVLIVLNIAVFVYELTLGSMSNEVFVESFAVVPARLFASGPAAVGSVPAAATLLTSMFLHGGWLHIIVNLWTLYIFGPALEDRLGPVRFAILYLLAGVAASLAHAAFNAGSATPTLGASGAIAGVIAAYAVRFRWAWVQVLVLIVFIPLFFWVPAMLFAGLWFATQVLQGTMELFTPTLGGGIAWWAHIGGFLTGWLLVGRLQPKAMTTRYGGPWGSPSR